MPQPEKALAQKRRPNTAIKKKKKDVLFSKMSLSTNKILEIIRFIINLYRQ